MIDSDTPELLRNIPIQIVVDDIEITGEILFAVPWFRYGYPQFALATRDTLTDRGRREAKWMLKELYDYSQGRRSGWGISRVDAVGRWSEIVSDFESETWRIQGV